MSEKNVNMERFDGTVTVVTSDTVTKGTLSTTMNGLGRYVEWVTPDTQDTDSSQLSAILSSGGTVFSTGTVAESTRFSVGSVFPVYGTVDWVVTVEGTQSANRAFDLHVLYEV